jgi:hypothetical protein
LESRVNVKHRSIPFGLLGAALIASSASAQGRGGSFFTPPSSAGTFFNAPANGFQRAAGFRGRAGHAGRRHRAIFYPGYGPYFYDPEYDYDEGGPEPAPPAPRTSAPAPQPETHKAADSVVMELRGDRWVRLTSTGPVEQTARQPVTEISGAVLPAFDPAPAALPLPAAILVFRDGHREEATRYTIVGNAIYLKGDYYATGSWTRRVLTADLDIPATLKLNTERATKFSLPSRPSEVILRP